MLIVIVLLVDRTGDQILEYNGTDLREATAEEAAFELAKPLDKVNILVQFNIQRKCRISLLNLCLSS